jgi:CMP-N-acetylneuraminic acid synthetase
VLLSLVNRGCNLLTIIPARGASKGILRKNLQLVNGDTLVERSIKYAKKIPNNIICLSSDDMQILEIGNRHGILTQRRSALNSTDIATSESVLEEVLDDLDSTDDLVTLLQPTSPFIDIKAWLKSIELMKNNLDIGSMFSAIEKNSSTWEEVNSTWCPVNQSKLIRLPRQLKNRTVHETGAFYVFRLSIFKIERTRFCGNSFPVITNIWSQFEIDNIEDLSFCNLIASIIDS